MTSSKNPSLALRASRAGVFALICVSAAVGMNAVAATKKAVAATPGKTIMKVVTASGKVIYTDRELPDMQVRRVETMRGAVTDRVLANSPEGREADAKKVSDAALAAAAASGIVAAAPAAPGNLVDWAKQQEATLKMQNQQIKEAQSTIAKNNCDQAKSVVAAMERGRAGKLNDKGQMEYLDDAQAAEQKAAAQKQMATSCT